MTINLWFSKLNPESKLKTQVIEKQNGQQMAAAGGANLEVRQYGEWKTTVEERGREKNNDECDYRETAVWLKAEFCPHAPPSSTR